MMLLSGTNNAQYRYLMRHHSEHFGWLMQPRSYYRNQLAADERVRWAMDNDAYNDFNTDRFISALEFMGQYRNRCLFVVCPDTVGSHEHTLEQWHEWHNRIKAYDLPVSFVAQDGCDIETIPWHEMNALFIGGTDTFKDRESRPMILEAQRRRKWVHVGRVNDSRSRLYYCLNLNVDSIDGTAFAHKPSKMLRWYRQHLKQYELQGRLL